MSRPDFSRSKKPYERPRPSDGMWVHDKVQHIPRSVSNAVHNGGAPAGRGPTSINNKLVVSNLHYNVTPKDLTSIFGQIGTLTREPHIKYDRSGRSTGIAFITFETPTEATRAKKQFDGIEAKGQKMSVSYDTPRPVAPGRMTRRSSAPGSLLDRIEKKPLLERLNPEGEKKQTVQKVVPIPETSSGHGTGPIRTRGRGGRRGGGAPAGAGGARPGPGPRERKAPKTAEELDSELDAYLREDTDVGEGSVPIADAVGLKDTAIEGDIQVDGDVEMA